MVGLLWRQRADPRVLTPESVVEVDDDLESGEGRESKVHGGADWP